MSVWSRRFKTIAAAQPFVRNPQKLAELVYGGRMGNVSPDDGWKFRGRGVPMLTGRENYRLTGKRLGLDLEAHPELVIDPRHVFAVAVDYWTVHKLNVLADDDRGAIETVRGVKYNAMLCAITRTINGGLVGLDDRAWWLTKTTAVWS